MAKTKTVAEILNKAADGLERYGWTQRVYGKARGPKCIMGAIIFAEQGRMPGQSELLGLAEKVSEAKKFLLTLIPGNKYSIVQWNDKKGRTKGQVIRLLRRAAKKAEAEEIK